MYTWFRFRGSGFYRLHKGLHVSTCTMIFVKGSKWFRQGPVWFYERVPYYDIV